MPAMVAIGSDVGAPASGFYRLRPRFAREHLRALQMIDGGKARLPFRADGFSLSAGFSNVVFNAFSIAAVLRIATRANVNEFAS